MYRICISIVYSIYITIHYTHYIHYTLYIQTINPYIIYTYTVYAYTTCICRGFDYSKGMIRPGNMELFW